MENLTAVTQPMITVTSRLLLLTAIANLRTKLVTLTSLFNKKHILYWGFCVTQRVKVKFLGIKLSYMLLRVFDYTVAISFGVNLVLWLF
jgi:hypothetical protein